jgi:hypothetical protein
LGKQTGSASFSSLHCKVFESLFIAWTVCCGHFTRIYTGREAIDSDFHSSGDLVSHPTNHRGKRPDKKIGHAFEHTDEIDQQKALIDA